MNSRTTSFNRNPHLAPSRPSLGSRLSFAVSVEHGDGADELPPGEVLIEEEIAEIKRYEVRSSCAPLRRCLANGRRTLRQ